MAIIQNLEAFVQSYPAGLDSVTDLQLSQNENGRQIRFAIGGVTIPAGSVATISGTKPDGVVYSNTGTIEGSDTVIFDEDVQMTAVFGTWYAKIRITNAGNTIASARVRFIIDKDPVDAGAIPSESQLNGLVAEAEEYAGAAEDAAERAAITYGSPLTAATASAMTDINRVYVYTGSESGYTYGNWYYYNGSAWVSGGVYNSAAVETDTTLTESGVPADAKATGDKIDELKDDLEQLEPGLSDEAKEALLDCFAHVAWIDDDGQTYYDALEAALSGSGYPKLTATFTPGTHTVFVDDSLSTLTPYLLVKLYENASDQGTTIESTDYTLSATLEEGENTVVVSYDDLRTAFTVNAVDYYNRHVVSYPSDDTLSILDSKQGEIRQLSVGYTYNQFVIIPASNRATIVSSHGESGTEIVDSNGDFMNSYFIPIPDDATKVKINLSPTSLYAYISYVVCWTDSYSGHHFYRHEDGGWVQNNAENTFTSRDNQFLALNFKANSAGTGSVSVSDVTVTFS